MPAATGPGRLMAAAALFVEGAIAAIFAIAVLLGDFNQGPLFFGLVFGPVVVIAVALSWSLPAAVAGRVITHGALLTGCVMFAFPFVWLVSTSFKYDEEIFVYPPRWIPAIPADVPSSPYVTAEMLAELPPEGSGWSQPRWDAAWPQLVAHLWQQQGQRIRQLPQVATLPLASLRQTVVHGLVTHAARSLPEDSWRSNDEALFRALTSRVDDELFDTVWDAVFRAVAVQEPTVQTVQRSDMTLPAGPGRHVDRWQIAAGPAQLGLATSENRSQRLVRYDFDGDSAGGGGDGFAVEGVFPLPMPAGEFLGVTLPLRQDRSWHHLRIEVEIDGRRYTNRDDLYLDQYRWQEIAFKLAHLDDRDERELGIWPLIPAADQSDILNQAGQFRVRLHVQRSGRLPATWNKYTHHYREAELAAEHWWSYVFNSVYLVLLNMLGQVLSCSLVAYAFSRLQWPGREAFFAILLATMMLPAQVTMIPVFMIFEQLGWYNTLRVLWAPSFLGSAFFIFLLRQFMKSIPNDLEDAAKIDGCSYFGIYWRIILPLVKPALAAVCIFTFMGTWNDFMGPLIYINDQRLYPLALGLFDFRAQHQTDFGMLMAASTLMTLPVIALFFVAQRYFIQGVTLTGIKG